MISDKPLTDKKNLDKNTVGFDWRRWWLENGFYTKQHECVAEDFRAEEIRRMLKQ